MEVVFLREDVDTQSSWSFQGEDAVVRRADHCNSVVVIVVEFVVILLTPLSRGGLSKERCGCFKFIPITPLSRGVRYQFLQEEMRLFG